MCLTTQRRSKVCQGYGRWDRGPRILTAFPWLMAVAAIALCQSSCVVPDPEYCVTDEDCARIIGESDQKYVCHLTHHSCTPFSLLSCVKDADCTTPGAPRCNVSASRCEPCIVGDDTSCAHLGTTPFCAITPGGATCVACLKDLDCPASAPICDSQSCRPCSKHTDCEGTLNCENGSQCTDSLVCISDSDLSPELAGRCAQNGPQGRIVYVQNDPAKCKDAGQPGTDIDQPYCNLDPAYDEAKSRLRTYVRAIRGSSDYVSMSRLVQSGRYVFIGAPVPSRGIDKPATVGAIGTTFLVSGAGNITIDGFDLLELSPHKTIIQCYATPPNDVPTLTLRNSIVRGQTPTDDIYFNTPAVDLISCKARIYGNVIGLASLKDAMGTTTVSNGGGLKISTNSTFSGISYVIENNVIAGNVGIGVNFYDSTFPDVTFRFNTVAYNGRKIGGTAYAGINCPLNGNVPIGYSIVVKNGTGTQFQNPTQCNFKQVVVGSSETLMGAGLLPSNPLFDAAKDDFSLSATATQNKDCCIDQAVPLPNETFPAFDRVGNLRGPMKWDIGAYEAPGGL